MTPRPKIFIYNNGAATAQESVADLTTLLTTEGIFSSRPDITSSDLSFAMDGLQNPIFVVPGGSVFNDFDKHFKKIKKTLGQKYSYIGICAGGFNATADCELMSIALQSRQITPQPYPTFDHHEVCCDIIPAYTSYGPFHIESDSINQPAASYVPYRVNLSLNHSSQRLSQLYVGGPTFFPVADCKEINDFAVLANYVNPRGFGLVINGKVACPTSLPAIIASPATENRGARFISGTHIEASVPNSRMLSLFHHPTARSFALSKNDLQTFANEQQEAQALVVDMLQKTFKPR